MDHLELMAHQDHPKQSFLWCKIGNINCMPIRGLNSSAIKYVSFLTQQKMIKQLKVEWGKWGSLIASNIIELLQFYIISICIISLTK